VYCVYCGRLCDFDETHTCEDCKIRIAKINERVYLICLLSEAYAYIPDISLREKIEAIISPPTRFVL